MFAIYSSAVMSLQDEECKELFAEPRSTLLSKFISATETALTRANFMATTNLVVLQTLVLHLLSVRNVKEPRANWTLRGVAIRIAQVMGFEWDGTYLGLLAFETEIRRRVWWQLKLHDFRTAELCGLVKFRDLDMGPERTQWSTNVNDDQLYPGIDALADESNKITDFAFVALRCEMAKFAADCVAIFHRQGKNASQWNLDVSANDREGRGNAAKILEETLETKYLRYCDLSQPLHLVTMLVTRYGLNVVRFMTHHPRRWDSIKHTPTDERDMVWGVSLKLLEQHNIALSNPQIKRFAWNAAYFRQWHAFIHVLDTLRADPIMPDAEKVWRVISTTYENTPDMITNMKKPIHAAMGNLCLKAYSDREAALRTQNTCLPPTPNFIMQLRQQREVARAMRQACIAKNSRSTPSVGQSSRNAQNITPNPDTRITHALDDANPTDSSYATLLPDVAQPGITSESDPFGFFSGLDDTYSGNLNMDLDLLLAQDYNMDDTATELINWKQWDAWLGESNVMRP
ncbi:hypothetical protein EJ02DRAFT_480139 [Clathrospora elynae]|uniref:Xylanolytic transcriptional activator regulatory domain-containing protein n=1 Tax=Clathrospora elynae TaxID=706981 RepID=A0A6A5S9L2_9PLEO|nr:hypothetical protein EJ02DRAFT_480139 [Clathrospora elynae]